VGSGSDAVNRVADLAIAGVGLALTSPVLAAAALAIKLEDGGPVLFRQTRVGKGGKDFELLKLRSMSVGAEHLGAGFASERGTPGTVSAGVAGWAGAAVLLAVIGVVATVASRAG